MSDEQDLEKREHRPLKVRDIFSEQVLQAIGDTLAEAILNIDYKAIIRQLLVNANQNYSMEGLTAKEQRQLKSLLEKMLSGKAPPGQVALTDAEKIELVHAFQESGLTQIAFLSRNSCKFPVSRTTLQRALRWYRANRE